jgi:catechol 2,3-dioxygenase-like lactoylglutathione lyase family enzyme
MNVKRIDHIGVVVEALDSAERLLADGFGLRVEREVQREDLHAKFLGRGDATIELISVADPEQRSARLRGERARIEHIAFEVDDLERAIAALGALGMEPAGPPRESAGALTVFTKPETSGGLMFQFVQRTAASPS